MIPNTGTIYYFITLILLCLLFWNPTTLFHPVVQCVKRENLHDHMTLASLERSRVDLWPKSQKSGSPVVLNIGFNTQTKKLSLPYFQQKLWREVSCKAKMWVKNAQMCFQLCCCCCCCLGKQWWNYRIKPSVLPISTVLNAHLQFCLRVLWDTCKNLGISTWLQHPYFPNTYIPWIFFYKQRIF